MNKLWLFIGGGLGIGLLVMVIVLATQSNKNGTTASTTGASNVDESGKTILTLWQPIDNEDVYKDIVENFESENPDVKVNIEIKDLKTYERESTNALSAQTGPDIWVIPNTWVPRHNDKVVAVPDNFFGTEKDQVSNLDYAKEKFVPIVSNELVANNQLQALPMFIDTLALYINKTVFKEVESEIGQTEQPDEEALNLISTGPATWNDLVKLVKAITKVENGEITRSAIALGESTNISHSDDILMAMMLQNKTQIISPDYQTATFNLPQTKNSGESYLPGKNAFDFYLSFSNPQTENYTWNEKMANSQRAFIDGQVAMIVDYQYFGQIIPQIDPNVSFKVMALPQIQGVSDNETEFKPVDFASYYNYTVPSTSSNQELAWNFLKYLYSSGGIDSYASATSRTKPYIFDDIPQSLKDRSERNQPFRFQAMSAESWYHSKEPNDAVKTIRNMINDVNTGKVDSQKALDTGAKLVTDILRETENAN
ncbi:MAG: Extracellular solute-binding protein family 1 [Berkelbacteria bacterium GW2011_GWA2_35_9]|uniref:Extracellular solute-binding protein family 1 n=1 Tax=Berkelbacteria bacterium GW2011_GWA2_35_9 TaxID=1618333 RepID=A0A0G0D3B5_9BACT|nr:MAG: Extracellular solute-binding protein family 1 [Berkelbacteria bacterium GW2011_GWA2_35_9]